MQALEAAREYDPAEGMTAETNAGEVREGI